MIFVAGAKARESVFGNCECVTGPIAEAIRVHWDLNT